MGATPPGCVLAGQGPRPVMSGQGPRDSWDRPHARAKRAFTAACVVIDALALLAVAETVLFTGANCNPVAAHWLRVYPPHLCHAIYLPINALTCSSPADQVLEIGPVYPGS
jgi:hypothetical protein